MRWRNVLRVSVAVAGLLALAMIVPEATQALGDAFERRGSLPNPSVASETDQREIVRALAAEHRLTETRQLVLLDSSATFCGSMEEGSPIDFSCASPSLENAVLEAKFETGVQAKLRQELISANITAIEIADPMMHFVSHQPSAEVQALLEEPNAWRNFQAAFPRARGYLQVSRAVLTADRRTALIYATFRCQSMCGGGSLHLLERTGDRWHIVSAVGLWQS